MTHRGCPAVSEEAEHCLEQLERRARMTLLGQMTQSIAHDFNNILNSQVYAFDLINKTSDKNRRGTILNAAAESLSQGRALTRRIMDFAAKSPGSVTTSAVCTLLEETSDGMQALLDMQIDLPGKAELNGLSLRCDPVRFETALITLLLAFRAAMREADHVTPVGISACALPAEAAQGPFVEIKLTAGAAGADPEPLLRPPSLEEPSTCPFCDAEAELGLVARFCEQTGGGLRVTFTPAQGTCVVMTLPR